MSKKMKSKKNPSSENLNQPNPNGADTFADSDGVFLNYVITPSSVYYTRSDDDPSEVNLTISVQNLGSETVYINDIRIYLPVGNGTDDLTNKPSTIQPVSGQPFSWDFAKEGDGIFSATPIPAGLTPIDSGATLLFRLESVSVNSQPGTALVEFEESHEGGTFPSTKLPVIKVESDLNITFFNANPTATGSGDPVELSWTTENASRVGLAPGDFPELGVNDSIIVNPRTSTTYTLTAYGRGPAVSAIAAVNIEPPFIDFFTAVPSPADAGGYVTLSWRTEYANEISIEPGGHTELEPEGSIEVQIWATTLFILTASNGGQSENSTLSVPINPVIINSFVPQPATGLRFGDQLNLLWNTTSASAGSIPQLNFNISRDQLNSGSVSARPDAIQLYNYSLRVSNELGTEEVGVDVLPMPLSWFKFSNTAPFPFDEAPLLLNFEGQVWAMASGLMSVIYATKDGRSWLPIQSTIPWQTRSQAAGAVFQDKMWIMGGMGTSGGIRHDVWSSPDGRSWTEATSSAEWVARRAFGCFVLDEQMFIVGGFDESGNALSDVWKTDDGVAWTEVKSNAFSVGRGAFGTVVTDAGVWVLAGMLVKDISPGVPTNEVWYSSDGASWNIYGHSSNWAARSFPNVAAIQNKIYINGGIDQAGQPNYDLHRLEPNGKWKGLPGPSWTGDKILLTGYVQYQEALWCIGGGLEGGTPNPYVWSYAPELD